MCAYITTDFVGKGKKNNEKAVVDDSIILMLVLALAACDGVKRYDEETTTEPHVHAFGEWTTVKNATCTEKGEHERTCECGEKETQEIAALGHTEVIDAAVDPTCTETGLTEGKHCSVCEEVLVKQNSVDTLGHSFSDWIVIAEAKCEAVGVSLRYCSVCNFAQYNTLEMTGHTEVINAAVEPTCTEPGWTEGKHCSVCDAVLVAQETVAALGHTETVDAAVAATCTETGLTEGKHCSVCETVLIAQETVAVIPHTEVIDVAVAPTCTETGLTEGKHCSVCETVLVAQETVAALGHTEVIDAAVAKTCTESGLTEGKHCSVCEEVLVAQETVPASHEWEDEHGFDTELHWHICSVCDGFDEKTAHSIADDGYCTVCDNPLRGTVGLVYFASSDGTYAEVVDYTGSSIRIVIADTYEGLPVTRIAETAFKNKKITSAVIPDSVTSIGSSAFYDCDSLTSITIPDSVTSIGDDAFYDCDSLTSITIPDSVTSIGENAFSYCSSLTSITIPDSVTSIGDYAFWNCSSLKSVTFGENSQLTSIGSSAFYSCSRLTSITIPDSVTSIGSSAFYGCTKLIEKVNGVSYAGNCVIDFDDSVVSVNIREGTTIIANSAFSNSTKMRTVTIPDSVKTIGSSAFYNCTSLTSITIPDSVTSIGDYAFWNCSSLTYNTYDNGYYLGNESNPYLVLIKAKDTSITSCEINSATRFIHSSAFSACSSLTSITIPDSVTSIGSLAFLNCSSLTSITIPDSVTSIGDSAFYYCYSLTSINFGGTKEQWNAISKGYEWNYSTGKYTIYCTDGNIAK